MILNIGRKSIQQLEEKWLTFIFEKCNDKFYLLYNRDVVQLVSIRVLGT